VLEDQREKGKAFVLFRVEDFGGRLLDA